jgi:hypothetical protein
MMDGFLVPKGSGVLDIYDAAPKVLPGVTYLSFSVKVKKTKISNCLIPAPAKS